jgi:hypothetical protein
MLETFLRGWGLLGEMWLLVDPKGYTEQIKMEA